MLKKMYSFFHKHYHTRYHGIYRHAKQLFIFDIGLLALAVLMLGMSLWFFFWKPGVADLIELSISLGGNRIKSGEEVRVTIDYANHSKKLLNDVALSLRLPEGFIVDRAQTPEPVFSNNSTLILPPLRPGGKGQATIVGRLWVTPQREEKIIGTFSYKQENSEEREQALTSFLLSLPESVLSPHLTVASSAFPNVAIPFIYSIENTGATTVEKIQLNAVGGTIIFEQPDMQTFSLAPKEKRTLTGKITLPNKSENTIFTITPTIVANNHPIPQQPAQNIITVVTPRVSAEAKLVEPVSYVEPKQKIVTSIRWQNDSNFSLKNQRLRLTPTPGTVDLKTTARENNLKIDGASLVADASNRTALANGNRGAGDMFTLNLIFLPTFTLPEGANTFTLTPIFEAEVAEVSGQTFTAPGTPATIPLATEVTLRSEVRYYTDESDQLGRGPLPPTVGETTKYWVLIRFTNTANPLRDASVSLPLPTGVEFTGRQSVTIGPELSYNQTTKTVSWHYRLIPARSQTGLYFEVAVRPSPDQTGKTLTLTKETSLTATDDIVGKNFKLTAPGLTNILGPTDRGSASGAAVVTQ